MSKIIKSTNGFDIILDDDIYDLCKNLKFRYGLVDKNKRYVIGGLWCPDRKKSRPVYLHRSILGALPKEDVDHINMNTLDNRRENLRLCNRSENMRNRGKNKSNTSGYKGVWFHRQNNNWCADIMLNRKKHRLGSFKTKEDAAIAYNYAAIRLHGEFAVLNNVVNIIE